MIKGEIMEFILAKYDYYGCPDYRTLFVNPNYIISMEYIGETSSNAGNTLHPEHYVIHVDMGNKVERLHITLKTGNELLEKGGIKL